MNAKLLLIFIITLMSVGFVSATILPLADYKNFSVYGSGMSYLNFGNTNDGDWDSQGSFNYDYNGDGYILADYYFNLTNASYINITVKPFFEGTELLGHVYLYAYNYNTSMFDLIAEFNASDNGIIYTYDLSLNYLDAVSGVLIETKNNFTHSESYLETPRAGIYDLKIDYENMLPVPVVVEQGRGIASGSSGSQEIIVPQSNLITANVVDVPSSDSNILGRLWNQFWSWIVGLFV
jgi:hypothetical protein